MGMKIASMAALLTCSVLVRAAHCEPPPTGEFETKFTTRSPLTEPKAIAARFKMKAVPSENYDLSEYAFLVFVPKSYDATKPMGLIVLVNYKASDVLPAAILPRLEEANCGMVVAKQWPDAWWMRAALALDAAHNLQQQYHIDPRRIYVMGGGSMQQEAEVSVVPQRLGMFFPDVFTGTIAMDVNFYRAMKSPGGGMWPTGMPQPDGRYLTMAKARPIIVAPHDDRDDTRAIFKAYQADGFKHVDFHPLNHEQAHYPNYTGEWIGPMIEFLDKGTKDLVLPTTKPATTRPTTAPKGR